MGAVWKELDLGTGALQGPPGGKGRPTSLPRGAAGSPGYPRVVEGLWAPGEAPGPPAMGAGAAAAFPPAWDVGGHRNRGPRQPNKGLREPRGWAGCGAGQRPRPGSPLGPSARSRRRRRSLYGRCHLSATAGRAATAGRSHPPTSASGQRCGVEERGGAGLDCQQTRGARSP